MKWINLRKSNHEIDGKSSGINEMTLTIMGNERRGEYDICDTMRRNGVR